MMQPFYLASLLAVEATVSSRRSASLHPSLHHQPPSAWSAVSAPPPGMFNPGYRSSGPVWVRPPAHGGVVRRIQRPAGCRRGREAAPRRREDHRSGEEDGKMAGVSGSGGSVCRHVSADEARRAVGDDEGERTLLFHTPAVTHDGGGCSSSSDGGRAGWRARRLWLRSAGCVWWRPGSVVSDPGGRSRVQRRMDGWGDVKMSERAMKGSPTSPEDCWQSQVSNNL